MFEQILQQSYLVIEFLIVNSIYAVLLACVVVLTKLIYPKLPKRIEYGLWCVVLLRLILPNDLSFEYAISSFVNNWLISNEQFQIFAESHKVSTVGDIMLGEIAPGGKFVDGNLLVSTSHIEPLQIFFHAIPEMLIEIMYFSWLGIVALVLLRYLFLRVKLLRMLNRSQPIVDYTVVSCANRWRLNFWIKGQVHVIAEDQYLSPFTFFFKAPIIFIPRKIITSKNEPLIESIIAHEMAHVKRYDSLWLVIQNLIQILYFFNPLVWIAVRRLSQLRENLCDEMVLSVNQLKPADYGDSLLKVLRFNVSGEIQSGLLNAFLGSKKQIKQRVKAIGSFKPFQSRPTLELFCVFIFAILFLPFAHQPTSEIVVNPTEIISKQNEDSPFPENVEKYIQLAKKSSND
ncbi:M56 family metallopeptidase [Aliikangiella coralliicola]|uniref:M56 family metallopeptidase n=1 Tax=Aliikangiella coralliicola TaxID=2592383 RepID=A0A545U7B6_9GAMM|nr:M56 family metallopeptidase [Aliikangiella coralliicola]TQV85303.1 M56 family metallopeptidase [Aliikangiella coralliicola]